MKSRLAFLFIVCLFCIQCQSTKKESIDVSQAIIKIDLCGITYKGEKLEMGTPIEDWIKVLGEPSRDTDLAFVWDDLGIAIDDWQNEDKKVTGVYIFFLNLDSPEAAQQMLNHARGWVYHDEKYIQNEKLETERLLKSPVYSDELSQKTIKEVFQKLLKKSYIYPFKVYQGVVDLNGFPVTGRNEGRGNQFLPYRPSLFRYIRLCGR